MTGIYKNWTTGVQVFVQGIETQTKKSLYADGSLLYENIKYVVYFRNDEPERKIVKPLHVFNKTYLKIS
jgi:hypothetical protein